MAKLKLGGNLWHHRDFSRLWLSDTVSQFGNQFTQFALPVLAILSFNATPFELGILGALAFLSYPALGLFVGVWVDRFRRRPIMIICNFGRMAVLGSIPLAFLFHELSLAQIFLVALLNGIFSVFFDVAYHAYLPVLIDRKDLIEGNQKLQISQAAAPIVGPGIAGVIYQIVGGAYTIAIDAIGYLTSAISLLSIGKSEEKKTRTENSPKPHFFKEMKEGINIVLGNPTLSHIAGSTATSNFGTNIVGAVLILFSLTLLKKSTILLGFVGVIGGVGFLVGVLLANKFTARLGIGLSLAVSIGSDFIGLATPLAQYGNAFFVFSAVTLTIGIISPMYNINQVSLRQTITPDRLQGRMNATMRTIVWGTIPAGSFVGGILGSTIGLSNTIYLGYFIAGLAVFWILTGGVYKIKKMPEPGSNKVGS